MWHDRFGSVWSVSAGGRYMTALELSQVISFFVGALSSIAFVLAFAQRW